MRCKEGLILNLQMLMGSHQSFKGKLKSIAFSFFSLFFEGGGGGVGDAKRISS